MNILPLFLEEVTEEHGVTSKQLLEGHDDSQCSLHEMFDVYEENSNEVPDVNRYLLCQESLSDDEDRAVPLSIIPRDDGGMSRPERTLYAISEIPATQNANGTHQLNRRIEEYTSDTELETDSPTRREWRPVVEELHSFNGTVYPSARSSCFEFSTSRHRRDRCVPDINESLSDSDEERVLDSSCFDSDHVVPSFNMEE